MFYQSKKRNDQCFYKIIVFGACIMSLLLFFSGRKSGGTMFESSSRKSVREAFSQMNECVSSGTDDVKNNFNKLWARLAPLITKCRQKTEVNKVLLAPVRNKDEIKKHVFSKQVDPSVVVTLGIGADTNAEETLKKSLPEGSEFFGADPILTPNSDLYSKIGIFFPFAVGSSTGRSTAMIRMDNGLYREETMTHIGIGTFLNIINRTVVDQLLMDNEGAEYEIFPLLGREKTIDKLGYTICQINVEFHEIAPANTELRQKFLRIWREIERESRFVPLDMVNVGHLRGYFVNVENEFCVEKYLTQFF